MRTLWMYIILKNSSYKYGNIKKIVIDWKPISAIRSEIIIYMWHPHSYISVHMLTGTANGPARVLRWSMGVIHVAHIPVIQCPPLLTPPLYQTPLFHALHFQHPPPPSSHPPPPHGTTLLNSTCIYATWNRFLSWRTLYCFSVYL